MSSQDNAKLMATAVGAAAAGAALAVMAMKMVETSKETEKEASQYQPRTSVLMNDPTVTQSASLVRQDSGNLVFPHNHEERMRRRIATRYQIENENSSPRESVTVRVPATSANVGPGCE